MAAKRADKTDRPIQETTSNEGRFSKIEVAPKTGRLDGTSYLQTRGLPK